MRKVICSHPWHTTLLDNAITQVALPSWLSHSHLESADLSFENFPKTRLAKELARTFDALRRRCGRIVNVTGVQRINCMQSRIADQIDFLRGSVWQGSRIDVELDEHVKSVKVFERTKFQSLGTIVCAGVPASAAQDPCSSKTMTITCLG